MGKIKAVNVQFDQNKTSFFAGEKIAGNIDIQLSHATQILRLVVSFEGKGKSGRYKENIYFYDIILYESRNEHSSGTHKYPFTFQLPAKLPTSIQLSNASIKYRISVRMKLGSFSSKTCSVPITITEVIDANLTDAYPVKAMTLQRKSNLFSNLKKLRAKDLLVWFQRGVYCPTEEIHLNVQYKDHTARNMGSIKARLNRYILFNPAVNKGKSSLKKRIKEATDNLNEKCIEKALHIHVPERTLPTNCLVNCVQVLYVVHLKVPGYPELKMPIIIGTKPFVDTRSYGDVLRDMGIDSYLDGDVSLETQQPFSESTGEQADWSTFPPDYIPENEFDLPPSYEETVNATAPIVDDNESIVDGDNGLVISGMTSVIDDTASVILPETCSDISDDGTIHEEHDMQDNCGVLTET